MSARVQLMTPSTAPLLARAYFADGQPDPITAAFAQVPELLDVALPFIGATLGPSFIALRAKEIVILRTSALLECTYCVAAHTVVACDSGLSRQEVDALRNETDWTSVFSDPTERSLMAWVDAIALGRGKVADETAVELAHHWSDAAVVELTVLIGTTMMLNRLCTGLELPTGDTTIARLDADGFGR